MNNIFNKRSSTYDELTWVNDSLFLENMWSLLDKTCKERRAFLDVATGTGAVLAYFAPFFDFSLGIDPSIGMLQRAVSRKNANTKSAFKIILGQGEFLPFQKNSFDGLTPV